MQVSAQLCRRDLPLPECFMHLVKFVSYLVLLIAIAFAVLLFTSNNPQEVEVNYLILKYTGTLSFVLGLTFMLGFFAALLVCFGLYVVHRTKLSFSRSKVRNLEEKVRRLEAQLEVRELNS